jgi:hypothetical protein
VPVKVPPGLARQVPPPVAAVALILLFCWSLISGLAQLIEKVPAKTPPAAICAVELSSMNMVSMYAVAQGAIS